MLKRLITHNDKIHVLIKKRGRCHFLTLRIWKSLPQNVRKIHSYEMKGEANDSEELTNYT